ncbi:MAG: putative periplasmic solute-binding protein [Microgenomates group bacterium GW2011_GWA2_46_7]|nr:MAG: putative periplasmic solute-binding protein [Microgenomates group bacterium GW2011_GWA2_46_7]
MTKKRKSTIGRYLAKFSLLALVLASIYCYTLTLPVSTKQSFQEFEVKRGESVKTVGAHLKEAGLLRSPLYFRYIVSQQKLTIQAGIYQIPRSAPPSQVALLLTKGLAVDRKLTIPEGYRVEQIAEVAGIPMQEFLVSAKGLEGRLFPDTYFVKADMTADELVDVMQNNFEKKVGEIEQDTLILASLVERETRASEEKPIVAGILKKRLASGWALELDATVQYFLGKPGSWWPNTTLLDRRLPSPYNTYLHVGLPPTPIGNPGLEAIRAVKNPTDSPYWFYLHDKTGTIHYAENLAQHNQNIQTYINR